MTTKILVSSFRGGTGKSTIASNIAYVLASKGHRVLVIDADIVSPAIHTVFGLSQQEIEDSFTDYLLGSADITDCVYDVSHGLKPESVLLVPGSMSASHISATFQDKKILRKLEKGMKALISTYKPDYVVVDTHPGINEYLLVLSTLMDVVLTVVRPDNQDYQGVETAADILSKMEIRHGAVLNKVHHSLKSAELQRSVSSAFGVDVFGVLPFAEDVMLAQSQSVFVADHPKHAFSKKLTSLVDSLFGVAKDDYLDVVRKLLSVISLEQKHSVSVLRSVSWLSKKEFKSYVDHMVKKKLVVKDGAKLKITSAGKKFLKEYDSIHGFVDEFGL